MDELDRLRELGAEVAPTDGEAKERARRRLRQRYPQPSEPAPQPPRRPGRRWILAAAMVALVMVAGALLPRGAGGPVQSAAQVLRHLASVAAARTNPLVPPRKFVYVRSEQLRRVSGEDLSTGAQWAALVRVTRQDWRAADGSGRILTLAGRPRFLSAADEAAWRRAGRPELAPPVSDERFPAGSYPTRDLSGLPLDPAKLRRIIERRSVVEGPPGAAATFSIVGMLLAEEAAPPKLRAALLEVAASLPGIEVIGQRDDPLGRASLALALTEHGDRTVLYFDPTTSALRARERFRVADGSRDHLLDWQAYWPPRIVNSPATPPRR